MQRLNDVVLVQIDCEKGEGVELAKEYNIKGYPTFILANAKAETYYRWMGYTKDLFFEKMDNGFSDLTTIAEKQTRFQNKPDAKTAAMLAEYSGSKGEYKEAIAFYKKAAELDNANDYAYEMYTNHRRGMRGQLFSMEELMAAADAALNSENVSAENKFYVLYGMSGYATRMPENEKVRDYLEQAKTVAEKKLAQGKDSDATSILINYALVMEKDSDKAVAMKKSVMPDGWQQDAGRLNQFSWWCFENRVNLVEAEQLAEKGVKLAAAGKEKAMILDTYAEILFVNDKKDKAIEMIKLAIQEDPKSDFYPKQLEKFKQ
jgi:tetratricopeptide (TPR) repeat protein